MLSTIRNKFFSDSSYSLYAQGCLLLANFLLFVVLLKGSETAEYGYWAIYITVITIADSFRQGFLQNGFIRLFVQNEKSERSLTASAALINYGFIAVISSCMWAAAFSQESQLFSELLFHGWKGLLALGSLQFLNMLSIARQNFRAYFFQNLLYLCSFSMGMIILLAQDTPGFIFVINLQLMASAVVLVHYLILYRPGWALPKRKYVKKLWDFGRYAAGTNLLSMLFHKADVLMLAWFTGSSTVALFHFATKLVGYADLPMNARSQVIYPELVAINRSKGSDQLKMAYLKSILRLLLWSLPIIIFMMLFNKEIINLLSTDNYESTSTVIIILLTGSLFKPVGRVFGLLLDAIGKPKVNFQMLAFSLLINISMNLMLIPTYGLTGAAVATSTSIVLTVLVGQCRLKKWMRIRIADWLPHYRSLKQKISFS